MAKTLLIVIIGHKEPLDYFFLSISDFLGPFRKFKVFPKNSLNILQIHFWGPGTRLKANIFYVTIIHGHGPIFFFVTLNHGHHPEFNVASKNGGKFRKYPNFTEESEKIGNRKKKIIHRLLLAYYDFLIVSSPHQIDVVKKQKSSFST